MVAVFVPFGQLEDKVVRPRELGDPDDVVHRGGGVMDRDIIPHA